MTQKYLFACMQHPYVCLIISLVNRIRGKCPNKHEITSFSPWNHEKQIKECIAITFVIEYSL